jgi:hypothetical protein
MPLEGKMTPSTYQALPENAAKHIPGHTLMTANIITCIFKFNCKFPRATVVEKIHRKFIETNQMKETHVYCLMSVLVDWDFKKYKSIVQLIKISYTFSF